MATRSRSIGWYRPSSRVCRPRHSTSVPVSVPAPVSECVYSVEQVAFADRMLLNKTDLVSEADLERVEKRLRALNGFAPIMRTLNSEISVDR